MTSLAVRQVEDPNQLALIADDYTPLAKPFADAFRDACYAEARLHEGWVNPSAVRARLIEEFGVDGYNPRQLSALWMSSCGKSGFLVKTDHRVAITGEGSRGNHNKDTVWRRWVG